MLKVSDVANVLETERSEYEKFKNVEDSIIPGGSTTVPLIKKESVRDIPTKDVNIFIFDTHTEHNITLIGYLENTHHKVELTITNYVLKVYVRINYDCFPSREDFMDNFRNLLVGSGRLEALKMEYCDQFLPIKGYMSPEEKENTHFICVHLTSITEYSVFLSLMQKFNSEYILFCKNPQTARVNQIYKDLYGKMWSAGFRKQSAIELYSDDDKSTIMNKFFRETNINPFGWTQFSELEGCEIDSLTGRINAIFDYNSGSYKAMENIDTNNNCPLIVLAWDIETCTNKDCIDTDGKNPLNNVICVGISVGGPGLQQHKHKYCLTFLPSKLSPGDDCEIILVQDERELIKEFLRIVLQVDPAIITGFNDWSFDWPIIADKVELFGLQNLLLDTRLPRTEMTKTPGGNWKSSTECFAKKNVKIDATQTKEGTFLNVRGIIAVDVRIYLIMHQKSEESNLNFYLKKNGIECKLDIDFRVMQEQYRHYIDENVNKVDPTLMFNVLRYCAHDAFSLLLLYDKCTIIEDRAEMALYSFTPYSDAFHRANSIKVLNMIAYRAQEKGYLIPMSKERGNCTDPADDELLEEYGKYPGAYVVEPRIGINLTPVSALDFASLYPSIIMGHNISPENIINSSKLAKYTNNTNNNLKITRVNIEMGSQELKEAIIESNIVNETGIFTQILDDLFITRHKLKKNMGVEKDPLLKQGLDLKERAIKVYMNTFYGATGTSTFPLFDIRFAGAVTALGQKYIKETHEIIKRQDIEIVYGDTDSVYFRPRLSMYSDIANLGAKTMLARAQEIAYKLQDEINNEMAPLTNGRLKMVFEESLLPSFMTGKKKYFGLAFETPPTEEPDPALVKYEDLLVKGIDFIKSEYPPIIKKEGRDVVLILMQQMLQLSLNPEPEMFSDDYRRQLDNYLKDFIVERLEQFRLNIEEQSNLDYTQFITSKRMKTSCKGGEMVNFEQRIVDMNLVNIQAAIKSKLEEDIREIDPQTFIDLAHTINLRELDRLGIPRPEMGEKLPMVYTEPLSKYSSKAEQLELCDLAQKLNMRLDLNEYIDMMKTTFRRLVECCFVEECDTIEQEEKVARTFLANKCVVEHFEQHIDERREVQEEIKEWMLEDCGISKGFTVSHKTLNPGDQTNTINKVYRENIYYINCIRKIFLTDKKNDALYALERAGLFIDYTEEPPKTVISSFNIQEHEFPEIRKVLRTMLVLMCKEAIFIKKTEEKAPSCKQLEDQMVKEMFM